MVWNIKSPTVTGLSSNFLCDESHDGARGGFGIFSYVIVDKIETFRFPTKKLVSK